MGGTNLISFTIDGTKYEAEDGMTWGEWIESDYNTAGFYEYNDRVVIDEDSLARVILEFLYVSKIADISEVVNVTDTIIQGYSYWIIA